MYFHCSVTTINFFIDLKIYIAPSKALIQEKLREWSQKFGLLEMNCLELTGDNEFYNTRNIQEADIILTTPEVNIQCILERSNNNT